VAWPLSKFATDAYLLSAVRGELSGSIPARGLGQIRGKTARSIRAAALNPSRADLDLPNTLIRKSSTRLNQMEEVDGSTTNTYSDDKSGSWEN